MSDMSHVLCLSIMLTFYPGITIGAVVVPQGMAYASLAQLPVEYGLYSSFMGVLIYWFFATSKDITIGVSSTTIVCAFPCHVLMLVQPVAVMSTVVGNIVTEAKTKAPDIPGHVIASALGVVVGGIVCGLGLLRLGWLVDFISLPAISAFMTGSAISIAAGQVPTLMGITFSKPYTTRDATYRVIINTLRWLPRTSIDAALGLTALTMLYGIRFIFNFLAKKQPHRRKLWFFCNTLRTVFVILLYTLISYLVNRHLTKHNAAEAKESPFKILGHVPRGFQHAAVPTINSQIVDLFTSELPASCIVLLIEHISIAKSFGRVNNYTINPSQELVAIGVSNLLGPFLGGYPSTGSFSRTAIKSKAGVRTPLAGVITAVVVLLAIYALPAVFFFIPNAALSAVIIHAVGDLITPPNTVYQFWRISPIEVIIFFAGVIVTVFTTIEIGIYVTVASSFALFVFRVFKAQGRFLGRVQVHSVIGDHVIEAADPTVRQRRPDNDPNKSVRNVFIPISHEDGSNPELDVQHPYPGIFIYRFSEGYNYPNANHYLDYMVAEIFKETRRTNPNSYGRPGDRPWNDPGPRKGKAIAEDSHKPTLKAVILDFSSVNNVDITSTQHLIDVRNQLDRWTSPDTVQWHFAAINNRWTKRALVSAGFGYPSPEGTDGGFHSWKPIFSVADIGGDTSAAALAEAEANRRELKRQATKDVESGRGRSLSQQEREIESGEGSSSDNDSFEKAIKSSSAYGKDGGLARIAVVQGLNRPFFHIDITSALQSAVQNLEVLAPVRQDNGVQPQEVDDAEKIH